MPVSCRFLLDWENYLRPNAPICVPVIAAGLVSGRCAGPVQAAAVSLVSGAHSHTECCCPLSSSFETKLSTSELSFLKLVTVLTAL